MEEYPAAKLQQEEQLGNEVDCWSMLLYLYACLPGELMCCEVLARAQQMVHQQHGKTMSTMLQGCILLRMANVLGMCKPGPASTQVIQLLLVDGI